MTKDTRKDAERYFNDRPLGASAIDMIAYALERDRAERGFPSLDDPEPVLSAEELHKERMRIEEEIDKYFEKLMDTNSDEFGSFDWMGIKKDLLKSIF